VLESHPIHETVSAGGTVLRVLCRFTAG